MTKNFSLTNLFTCIESHSSANLSSSAHLWNPPFCGNIPILIHTDGAWSYNGTPINRIKMIKLFASVLRKEKNHQYFLVTPYEKLGITVEDVPFIMTLMKQTTINQQINITLTTQLNESVIISPENPLEMRSYKTNNLVPYVRVRDNLYGRLHRNLYYQILDHAEVQNCQTGKALGINSAGNFFILDHIN